MTNPWAPFAVFFWTGTLAGFGLAFAAGNALWMIAPALFLIAASWTSRRAFTPDFTVSFYLETFDETD